MLNYSKSARKDPNENSTALKCALSILGVFIIGFVLYATWDYLVMFRDLTKNLIVPYLIPISIFFFLINIWSACVLNKTSVDYLLTKKKFAFIGAISSIIGLTIFSAYLPSSLELEEVEKYLKFMYTGLLLVLALSLILFGTNFFETIEKIKEQQ
jgi:hypothetical protein